MPETLLKKNYWWNDLIKWLLSMSIYQIGYVSLKVSFILTIINILKTRNDVFICAHGTWIGLVYSQEFERGRFPIQSDGKIYSECKYLFVHSDFLLPKCFLYIKTWTYIRLCTYIGDSMKNDAFLYLKFSK